MKIIIEGKMNNKILKSVLIPLWTILVFSLYVLTDTIELVQSGFSPVQLMLTYIAMAGIPFSLLGLYSLDSVKGGLAYLTGAVLISISFVYFSGTATYALAEMEGNYGVLVKQLGLMYNIHGVILVIGGFLISYVLFSKKIVHPIVALLLFTASTISLVTGIFQLSEAGYVIGNYVRNSAFILLGINKLKLRDIV